MSTSERALMESELADLVEGEFSYPVIIKGGPSGLTYTVNGFIQYDAREESTAEIGMVEVLDCVVVLRISSCPSWIFNQPPPSFYMQFPANSVSGSSVVSWMVDGSRAPKENRTLGIVRLYPKRV